MGGDPADDVLVGAAAREKRALAKLTFPVENDLILDWDDWARV